MRVTIHLAPTHLLFMNHTAGGGAALMHAYRAGEFAKHVVSIPVLMEGEKAAEEMFDLTNNPYRQVEREERYGRHRSVSVGDIIEVEEQPGLKTTWRCESMGWKQLGF